MGSRTFRKSALRAVSLMFSVILCSGCISTPPVDNLPPAPRDGENPAVSFSENMPRYRLQIGDVIDIKFLVNPELNEEVTVQPDGMISTSVVQDVQAYGRTAAELKNTLTILYKDQLKNPRMTVIVKSFAPNRVYVLGEVNQPGEFITIGPELTLLQSIARAGGIKNSADPQEVVIIRRGAGEHPTVYAASYAAAVSGEDPGADVRLAPYDTVYVPRSGAGDVYLNFQQYIQEFVPASFGLSYQLNNTAVAP